MRENLSLRERKKRATRALLMNTALDLFEQRGFDDVSVAEVADAAGVSKATVFNYFPTKEDLVVGGAKQHIEEPAQIVRARPAGATPHGAMRDYFLDMLDRREPMTGLSDHPTVLKVQRVIRANPALGLRAMDFRRQAAVLLARELMEEGSSELTAHLVASQLLHVQHILAQGNLRRVHAGESTDAIHPDAVRAAEHAFRLLEHGIGDFMRRNPDGTVDVAFHGSDRGPRAEVERALREAEEQVLERWPTPDTGDSAAEASDCRW